MISSNNKHGYMGVVEMRGENRWAAKIIHDGQQYRMYAGSAEEAAKLFDEKAIELGIYDKLLAQTLPKERERKNRKLGSITYQKDRKRWRARIRINGEERFYYAKTKEEAEGKLLQLGKELGVLDRLEREPKPPTKTGKRNEPKYSLEELAEKREQRKWKNLPAETKKKELEKAKARREADVETARRRSRESYQRHKKAVCARSKVYRDSNKDKVRVWRKHREHAKRSACPKWAWVETREKVKELQIELERVRNEEGRELHLEHIIPVKGKTGKIHVVCGLHISYNLRLLDGAENEQKSCYTWDDMWDYDINEIKRLQELEQRLKDTKLASA